MRKLLFIRHGETDWNCQRKLQGHTDIPLNPRGIQQAQALIPFFDCLPERHLISSDLSRARQTAEVSQPLSVVEQSPFLREIFLGEAEGLTREQIHEKWGLELWNQWADLKWPSYDVRFPGGESRREGINRMLKGLSKPLGKETDLVCLYTHGLLLRSFAQWAANTEEHRYTTPNCCVYEFEWNPQPLTFDSPPATRPHLRQIYFLPEESLSL